MCAAIDSPGRIMSIILLVHALLIGVCISVADNRAPGVSESENNQRLSDVAGVNWPRNREVRQKRDAYYNGRNGLEDPYKDDTSGYDGRIGLLLFTRYCGPGSRIWKKFFVNDRSYADIDRCCKMHDDCPNFVEKREHYIRYPGLEFRPQYFSRWVCTHVRRCIRVYYIWWLLLSAGFSVNVIPIFTTVLTIWNHHMPALLHLDTAFFSAIVWSWSIQLRNAFNITGEWESSLFAHNVFCLKKLNIFTLHPQFLWHATMRGIPSESQSTESLAMVRCPAAEREHHQFSVNNDEAVAL